MTAQRKLGKTLRDIADQLRGAMNSNDFRDYILSFLFLRYLSVNYKNAARREGLQGAFHRRWSSVMPQKPRPPRSARANTDSPAGTP